MLTLKNCNNLTLRLQGGVRSQIRLDEYKNCTKNKLPFFAISVCYNMAFIKLAAEISILTTKKCRWIVLLTFLRP